MININNYQSKQGEFEKRAKELVSKMTLSEKVFQTLHSAPKIDRLGIKEYNWWNESLHGVARAGVATIFPQAIGMAATFDKDLIGRVADCISTEGRAKFNVQQKFGDTDIYKGLTFWAPNVNIFRDPRWGRGHETFGEDPYLTSRMAVSYINSMQGNDPSYMKVAACAKHFAVHSGPEDIRHSFNAIATKQDMYETYLPAFEACVKEAKVETVMGAYNRVNGEPACGSKTLLIDILRNEWGFNGHVTSDCWAIKDFHEYHKVTSNEVESVAMAMNNGCDLNCGNIFIYLKEAVQKGLVKESRLDEAVERLFVTRMKLGLFDDQEKVQFNKIPYNRVDNNESEELNFEIARKCLVLLKNKENILPLDKNKIKTIGIIGPNANNRRALVGNYEGTASRYYTVSEGIQEYLGDETRVLYSEGCHLNNDRVSGLAASNDRMSEVKAVCEDSDVIIACMGLDSGLEGEEGDHGNQYASGDKANLELPGLQNEVLEVMNASGKPVILILLSGSALAVKWADENIPAIIQGWYPGALGGKAIASVLFGDYSPEGKLPITFYKTTEELGEFTDYLMKDKTYRYMEREALYPFGFGLSYTDFVVENVVLDKTTIEKGGEIKVSAEIVNNGNIESAQTLQVYIKVNRENTPNAQLKSFSKVTLKPGERKTVTVTLSDKSFALYNEEAYQMLYKGDFDVHVGMSQPDSRSVTLMGCSPKVLKVICEKEEVLFISTI